MRLIIIIVNTGTKLKFRSIKKQIIFHFRQGLDSHVLRFFARLDTNRPIDMDRTFIISFFLSDDTISVFEPEKRNSGIVHGKFIERSKIKKPSGEYYQAEV